MIVTEHIDRLEFISVGEFFDQTPEDYMLSERVPRQYRNPFLVTAMTELNLIDHLGNGIHRIVADQRRRFLPMPDYDLNNPTEVKLTIHGAVIDEAYTQLMMVRTDLSLEDVLALDRVQKNLPVSSDAAARLKRAHLVEGRRPHLHVSAVVAAAADTKADYIRRRAQDDEHYARLITDYLTTFGQATRQDITNLPLGQAQRRSRREAKAKQGDEPARADASVCADSERRITFEAQLGACISSFRYSPMYVRQWHCSERFRRSRGWCAYIE